MTTANIMYFDVELNANGEAVAYAISNDGYLYVSLLKDNAKDMVWVRGKNPATSVVSGQGLMKVYKSIIYLCDAHGNNGKDYSTLYVTKTLGDDWNPCPVGMANGGYAYDIDMYITDACILLASGGEPGALIKSTNGGVNWSSPVSPLTHDINAINGNNEIIAVGGNGEVSFSTINGINDLSKWHYFNSSQTNNLIDIWVEKIIFDDRYSMVYLIQETGISYGKLSITNDYVNIAWNTPFINIKDYNADSVDYFIFGDTILQTMGWGEDNEDDMGRFVVYKLNGTESDESKNYIREVEKWKNPYADSTFPEITPSSLRVINPIKGGGAYKLYLSNQMTFSMSSNEGKDWQEITINV